MIMLNNGKSKLKKKQRNYPMLVEEEERFKLGLYIREDRKTYAIYQSMAYRSQSQHGCKIGG